MEILYTKLAIKSIGQLDRKTKLQIKKSIEMLPFGNVKKLKGYKNHYRLRVGNYRVLYIINNSTIEIQDVKQRKNAYKG